MKASQETVDFKINDVKQLFEKIFQPRFQPKIEKSEDCILIDGMTISPVQIERRTIGRTVMVQGWELTKEVPYDDPDTGPAASLVEISTDLNIDNLVVLAVNEWANLIATQLTELY